jgi:hypothetical protein
MREMCSQAHVESGSEWQPSTAPCAYSNLGIQAESATAPPCQDRQDLQPRDGAPERKKMGT